jgi:hypothetical protein
MNLNQSIRSAAHARATTAMIALCLMAFQATAQTAANNCGYNAGNQYTVGTSCTYQDFDKPGSFSNDFTPAGNTCSSGSNDDAWGWFTATATTTYLTFDPDNNHRAIMHVFSGACGSLTQTGCVNAGSSGNNANLTITTVVGTNYLVRIQRHNDNSGMDGQLCIWSDPPPPANDDPCSAVSLTVSNSTCSNTAGTNAGATATGGGIPAPGCAGYSTGDVWFTFVAPANGIVNLTTSAGTLTNSGMALYSATACAGTYTLIECDDDDGPDSMSNIQRTDLTPGQTYYVRVWGNGATNGTFNICAVSLANDAPCGAVSLTVNSSCSTTASTNAYATTTTGPPAPGCASFTGGDVWFSFIAPASGGVDVETQAGGLTNSGMALYSATGCSGTFTLLACDDDGGPGSMAEIFQGGLTPGQTYYLRVWGFNGASGDFTICVMDYPIPVNDEPCNAIALSLTSACTYASYTNVNATGTAAIPAPGCGSYSSTDVWFSFVAPANGLVTLRTTAGTLTNADMAVYSATACNGTYSLVLCDGASGPGNMPFITLTPLELVSGETYYVRVWGNGGSTGTFNLCANTAANTGNCTYVLRMYDSQGDGWGASNVSVQVGAAPAVSYSITNSDQEVAYIEVASGDIIQLTYNTGGAGAQGEIRYILQLMYGMLYSDGPTPGTGLRYAAAATCQSPTASQSDCYGNTAICDAQQINANPNSTGLSADLNLHSRGCLGSNERQGYWYSFTPSSGGTLGFTISPDNAADDYDFAIWGPYTSLSCPPKIAPVRCNYSGDPGDTGLSTLGTNPSEGGSGNKWSTRMTIAVGEYYFLYISNYSQSGLAFDLSWQLTDGASLDCQLLPIQLLGLNGYPVPQGIQLEWATATEANSSSFLVERLGDNGAFEQIGAVPASGFSSSTSNYAFVDPQPLNGFNHYRLKLLDTDGTASSSDVVAVMHRYGQTSGVLYPNPATDFVHVDLAIDADGTVLFDIIDASGRLVRREQQARTPGDTRATLPLHGLDAGFYELVVSLSSGEVIRSGRFMVE